MSDVRVYDRSRVTTDWSCPRKRYWGYEYGGKGLVNPHSHLELFLGTAVHDGLAGIAHGQVSGSVDIDGIADACHHQVLEGLLEGEVVGTDTLNFANEQAAMVEGQLRGFYKYVWPRLMATYPRIVAFEQEMRYDHDGLVFMAKPDLVVADTEGNLVYVEYKTTSTKKDTWINSWDTAIQLHSSIRAIQASLGEPINQVLIQGLYKGYVSYGKQNSPFCYAYRKSGSPPFTQDQVRYDYLAGFKRHPTWELPGGVRQWVQDMPDEVLAEQFPQTPPIFVNDDILDGFFNQRGYREQEIKLAMEVLAGADDAGQVNVLNVAFPQKFDQCYPAWGKPCVYRRLCHGHVDDPLTNGYEYRTPHHTPEQELWDARDEGAI